MPASIARIALSQHNWDKQDLLSKFFDDQDKFFQKINVLNPFQEVATTSTASTSANNGECLTCYGEYPSIVSFVVVQKKLNAILMYTLPIHEKIATSRTHAFVCTMYTCIHAHTLFIIILRRKCGILAV